MGSFTVNYSDNALIKMKKATGLQGAELVQYYLDLIRDDTRCKLEDINSQGAIENTTFNLNE